MTLKSPNLDDRSFADLMRQAFAVIGERVPQWNDRSPADPGVTLLQVLVYSIGALGLATATVAFIRRRRSSRAAPDGS